MPGQHSDEERERKERIKKLKAKTSKMRLAVIKKKSNEQPHYEGRGDEGYGVCPGKNCNRPISLNSHGEADEVCVNCNKGGDPAKQKLKAAAVKKKKKEYDQDGENEHNRDNYNAQSSVETGGDY